jgi:hypothetical protein
MSFEHLISDDELSQLVKVAQSLGFGTSVAERDSLVIGQPAVVPEIEDEVRRSIQDNAQFIVPVTWSARDSIGLRLPDVGSVEETMKVGLLALIEASAQEVAQWGYDPKLGVMPWAALDAYLHSAVRATAQHQDGMLRQGFLAACLNGVALIGLSSNWSPEWAFEQERESLFYLRDRWDIVRWIRRKLPPPNVIFSFNEIAYIPYQQIQDVKVAELLRLDGLAAFIAGFEPGNQPFGFGSREGKAWSKLSSARREVHTPFGKEVEAAAQFPEIVRGAFQKVNQEIVSYGVSQASGVPIRDGQAVQQLFSKGLSASFVDARNGTGFMVESVFSELDAAIALISDLRSQTSVGTPSASQNQPVKSDAPTPDLASQLQKIAELHASGLLTDEEFRDAKMKLLG